MGRTRGDERIGKDYRRLRGVVAAHGPETQVSITATADRPVTPSPRYE